MGDRMKPTTEQIKEFWEWCGFSVSHNTQRDISWTWGGTTKELGWVNLDLDLNNLFKYAVDWDTIETIQFSYGDDGHHCWIYIKKNVGKPFHGYGETDEDALFWAIWEMKQDERR